MNITISHAGTIDIEPMAELIQELFAIETDFQIDKNKQVQALSLLVPDPSCDVIVARDGDTLVGMATMQPVISTAEGGYVGIIEDVIVADAYRKQGIGSQLIDCLEKIASKKRYKVVKLLADRDNKRALEFYRSQNFSQTRLMMLRKRI